MPKSAFCCNFYRFYSEIGILRPFSMCFLVFFQHFFINWLNVSLFSILLFWGFKTLIACPSSLIYAVKIFYISQNKKQSSIRYFCVLLCFVFTGYFNKVSDYSCYPLLLKVFLRFLDFGVASLFLG